MDKPKNKDKGNVTKKSKSRKVDKRASKDGVGDYSKPQKKIKKSVLKVENEEESKNKNVNYVETFGTKVADVELSSEDLTAEEKRILQRKLKKERKKEEKRLKREQGTTSVKTEVKKYSGAELSLEYLMRWSRNRSEWKFQKARQTWLLQHMYDTDKVPDEYFPVLLEYLEGLRGHARNTTVQKAEEIMREHEKCEVSVSPEKVQRAREILQMLS